MLAPIVFRCQIICVSKFFFYNASVLIPSFFSMAHVLTSSDFDSTIALGVTLVDFYADWCGPCQRLIPVIDDMAKIYNGRANICKLDVDATGDIAQRYGIMSIPTLLLFKDGQLVEKVVGLQSQDELTSLVEKHLA